MQSQMLTSKLGGELISYKLDGIEKIHQGQDCTDANGRVYWKRHFPVLFPIVGKLKQNKTIINGRTYEMGQHGFARDLEFEPITKLDNFHSYVLRVFWFGPSRVVPWGNTKKHINNKIT